MCKHEKVECPRHEGGFDCTPFCDMCEGEQEVCLTCLEQEVNRLITLDKEIKSLIKDTDWK